MPFNFAEKTLLGRKSRQILLAGVAGGTLVLGSGVAFVSAQDAGGLDAIFAAEDENPCENLENGAVWLDVVAENRQAACAQKTNESAEVAPEDIDLGGEAYVEDDSALSDEEAAVMRSLSDEEANEVTTLFDEEDSDPQETAEVGATAQQDVAAAEEPAPAESDEGMDLDQGETDMAAAPDAQDDEAGPAADGGEADGFDSAEAGSNSADTTGTIQGTGSLVAVGVGEGLSNAISDPTSLDSVADVVVGTDPENGSKDNVAQVTALGGVTDGALVVTVLEGIDGDNDDPLGQVLAVDADNAPSGPGATPSIDGIAEVNVGDDPDGQSFNVVQVDAFDDNFPTDGSTGLANVAVGDGLDEGFGSLIGISIGGKNNGEHDDLANIALGDSFDPLAEPLLPLTGGVNDLGVTLGQGLAPLLVPLADALP